jgi:hypothetical protein
LGPNNTKNFLFYKATSQMESDFELLSNNAKISFSNNLSEFNERINNFYPTMQNNFNFE